ncbi:MAG: AAA domain-containing protein [Planctomycetota bacterium]
MHDTSGPTDRGEFASHHRALLRAERAAEVAENERLLQARTDAELVARGTTLLRLEVADLEPGFGGRLHATLRPSRGGELPAHRFGPGDVVALRQDKDSQTTHAAVVVRTRRDQLIVALDDGSGSDDDGDLPTVVRLDRLTTDVTYRRLDDALSALAAEVKGERARFLDVLFGHRDAEFAEKGDVAEAANAHPWFDKSLDASQQAAITHALAARHLACIHGPPGTGKTTALVELVRHAVARGERLLCCAPSNVAVDNLTERLVRAGLKVVRLGHPARVSSTVRDVSLAQQLADSPDKKVLRDQRREFDAALRRLHKASGRRERAEARNDVRRLRKERRQLEQALSRGIVDAAEVVLATTTGARDAQPGDRGFDCIVIDEAAQALEAACWIPLVHGERVVLAGDHHQLPPVIVSPEAADGGLARTLFERLGAQRTTADCSRMLTRQYRMHEKVMAWSSATFYGGKLEAAPAVANHRLIELDDIVTNEWTDEALCFVDTAGCGHEETADADEQSKRNDGEAGLVVRIVTDLLEAGVSPEDIAVITPYNAQVQLLRERLPQPELEIGTVDGLQGREKEAVVVSLVRSNERGEVGFLAELRRLNVALTRARRHLTVVGDSATIASDDGLRSLIDHLQEHGCYRSAFEFV